jgi:branched-chain amino acid transport system permease protein
VAFKVLQDILSGITPQYWQFWIGLILVVLVLAGRERLTERIRGFLRGATGRARPGAAVPASVREARP